MMIEVAEESRKQDEDSSLLILTDDRQ